MKKLVIAGVAALALAVPAVAGAVSQVITVAPTGGQGCVVGPSDTCTYVATRPGGYLGHGTFTITATHQSGGQTITDASLNGNSPMNTQGCQQWPAGDTVVITTGADGGVAAGNPYPSQTDNTPLNQIVSACH